MRRVVRISTLLAVLSASAAVAGATPVTWESYGTIGFFNDPLNQLPNAGGGTPYTFSFTFDPAAIATGYASGFCGGTANFFDNSTQAQLAVGGVTYGLVADGIFEVYDPLSTSCDPQRVQFVFGAGQPISFLQASMFFEHAAEGILPDSPSGSLEILAQLSGGLGQFSGVGDIHPVPEPATLTLLTTAALGFAGARLRRRSKAAR
jgi:hypothetical protein